MVTEAQRTAARERKRRQRERERESQIASSADSANDDDPSDAASDQLLPSGIVPSDDQPGATNSLMEEQALWVKRRRQITELELRRRRDELIPKAEAERQAAALTRRIRAALDRAPALLPGDLSPDNQAACRKAMSSAIAQALSVMA